VVLDKLKDGMLWPDIHPPELKFVYAAALKHDGIVGDPAWVWDPGRRGAAVCVRAKKSLPRQEVSVSNPGQGLGSW